MEAEFSKKWAFLRHYVDVLAAKAVGRMRRRMRKCLVFTGGTSLHLYSARLIFGDAPIRASEDLDFFNKDSLLLENPKGIAEAELAKAYSQALRSLGFESEQKGSTVLIRPHGIKAEFFHDSRAFPSKTYSCKGLSIVHPESLFRIKLGMLSSRESTSIRDLIDVLYLSTKYTLPRKVVAREDASQLLEWNAVENYLTEEGAEYFRKNNYQKIAGILAARVEVHEKD
jgi:predicted nucleotidyltransferase component of viral defense system